MKRKTHLPLVLCTICAALSAGVGQVRGDRFSVPTPSGGDSSPPSSSGPSDSGPSSGSGPSSSSSDSYGGYPGSDRFHVPTPSPGSSRFEGRVISNRGHYWGGYYYYCGDYYYWDGYLYSPHRGGFSRYQRVDRGPTVLEMSQGLPIAFPPLPPPLGAGLPKPSPVDRAGAPKELQAHIYEPYYPTLSTRLLEKNLNEKLRARLAAYTTARTSLVTALQVVIDGQKDAEPAARQSAFQQFSRENSARAADLEQQAEQLRVDLLRAGVASFFLGSGDWNESRQWKLGVGRLAVPRDESLPFEFRVMRAAAYYQEGLSPAQRRLLREVAAEIQVEAYRPAYDREDASESEDDLVSFQPETARIKPGADLPASLGTKLAVFEKEKSDLKAELREAIYELDRKSRDVRQRALAELARQQEPRLRSLETLAEDIRVEFVQAGRVPGATSPQSIPPELSARLAAYHKEKVELQQTLQTELKKAGLISESSSIEATEYNRRHSERFAKLNQEREAIRREISQFANSSAGRGKTVDTLMREFVDARHQQDTWHSYRDYQVAVLQPGLSPELRRILFNTALEKLSLPLPSSENQP